jgi:ankyrin repeat protein
MNTKQLLLTLGLLTLVTQSAFALRQVDKNLLYIAENKKGTPAAVEKEILLGADINVKDLEGKTALMIATRKGRLEIVNALLKVKGVDVNLQDKLDRTALMAAVINDRIEIVKVLLSVPGIKVELKGKVPTGPSSRVRYNYLSTLEFAYGKPEIEKLIKEALVKQKLAKQAQTLSTPAPVQIVVPVAPAVAAY